MTPLIDLPALIAWLQLAGLVLPATLALLVLRAVLVWRMTKREEEFEARCRAIDVDHWRPKGRAA